MKHKADLTHQISPNLSLHRILGGSQTEVRLEGRSGNMLRQFLNN